MCSGTFCGSVVRRARHVRLFQSRAPAFESLFFGGMVDALLDVADGFQIFIQLLAVAGADLGPERARFGEHGVENAAVKLAAFAVADQLVEGARRIDFLGGGFGRRHPRDVRAVNHREAVFQPQLVRLDPQRQTRHGGLIADALRQHLVKRRPYADLFRVQADRRAGEQIHSAQVRACGRRRPSDDTARAGRSGLRGSARAVAPPGRIPCPCPRLSPTSAQARRRWKSRCARIEAAACSHLRPRRGLPSCARSGNDSSQGKASATPAPRKK